MPTRTSKLAPVSVQNALTGLWRNEKTGATIRVWQYRTGMGKGYPRESMRTTYTSGNGLQQYGMVPVAQLKKLLATGWVLADE